LIIRGKGSNRSWSADIRVGCEENQGIRMILLEHRRGKEQKSIEERGKEESQTRDPEQEWGQRREQDSDTPILKSVELLRKKKRLM